MALAGLLTYSPLPCLPVPTSRNSGDEWALVLELTAAGQSGIYTWFPFNRSKKIKWTEPKALLR